VIAIGLVGDAGSGRSNPWQTGRPNRGQRGDKARAPVDVLGDTERQRTIAGSRPTGQARRHALVADALARLNAVAVTGAMARELRASRAKESRASGATERLVSASGCRVSL
jgi:hypothetical protein